MPDGEAGPLGLCTYMLLTGGTLALALGFTVQWGGCGYVCAFACVHALFGLISL